MGFVRNLVLFPAVKMFFENLLRTDKVNAMSLAHDFFWGGGDKCIYNANAVSCNKHARFTHHNILLDLHNTTTL